MFPPVVPSDIYNKEDEELNIVSPEEYKEMCLKSNPFKPFVICESFKKKWEKEEEQNILRKKQTLKMKQNISGLKLSLNDFIVEFENTTLKKRLKIGNIFNKRYKPKKIDLNCIKSFFDEMRNIKIEYNNN